MKTRPQSPRTGAFILFWVFSGYSETMTSVAAKTSPEAISTIVV